MSYSKIIQNQFDLSIHQREFKLRMLLTNTCNKNCAFCLNDFQEKPSDTNPVQFLDHMTSLVAIVAYRNVSTERGYEPQIYLSGGEPTLHPQFDLLVYAIKNLGCRLTVNTNGTFPENLDHAMGKVDCLHFGVYEKSEALAKRIVKLNGSLQCVYSSVDPYVNEDFVKFYLDRNVPVKVFGDLKEDNHSGYIEFTKELDDKFPNAPIQYRYIGIQQNRGVGCFGCTRDCVTLKAAWVFPDSKVAFCPQKKETRESVKLHLNDWTRVMERIEALHRKA